MTRGYGCSDWHRFTILGDSCIFPFRTKIGDRIVEFKLAFFPERHGGDSDHRLGHGVDPKECVAGHRFIRFDIAMTKGFKVADFAVAPDQADNASHMFVIDLFLHGHIHGVERINIQSRGFRRFVMGARLGL